MKPKFRTILVVCLLHQFIAIPTQATTTTSTISTTTAGTTTTNPTTNPTTAGTITSITGAKDDFFLLDN